MRFASIVGCVLPLALAEMLVIPQVDDAVKLQLAQFSDYYADAYAINNTVESREEALPLPESRGLEERAATVYWYEAITKRGISAFNNNPTTYKIYRNVKDYGAIGYGSSSTLKM